MQIDSLHFRVWAGLFLIALAASMVLTTGGPPRADAQGIFSNVGKVITCDSWADIDQTSGEQIITGVAGERIYVCAINLVTDTAQDISVVSGTGTVCATSPSAVQGLSGGSTAATGWNFAANGGIAYAGYGALARTDTDADNLCVLQSGSGQISGGIFYTSR